MEDVDGLLLLLAAIVEEQGGEIRVSDAARVAVERKALEVWYEENTFELIVRLVEPSELAKLQMEAEDE